MILDLFATSLKPRAKPIKSPSVSELAISYIDGLLTAPLIFTNCSAGLISITSPASIVISSDLSPSIKSLYKSKLKVSPLFLL